MVFILMLLAAAGMIFGAVKMKQGFEWGKGLTVACAIIALLLAGAHIKSRMGQGRLSSGEIKRLQEREAAFQRIGAEKLASHLAQLAPNGRAVVIRPTDYGYQASDVDNKLAGLRKGFGQQVEIVKIISPEIPPEVLQQIEDMKKQYMQETGETQVPPEFAMGYGPMMDMMDASQFNKLAREIPADTEIVVLLVDFPYDLERMALWTMRNRPKVGGLINMPQPKMKAAIKSDFIHAVVLGRPDGDYKSTDVPKAINEAFDRRYLLVTKENVDEVSAQYEGMFPVE